MSVKEELHALIEALPEDQAAGILDELRKLQELRAAIDEADEQLATGDFIEYDENTIPDLAEAVKTWNQASLAQDHTPGDR